MSDNKENSKNWRILVEAEHKAFERCRHAAENDIGPARREAYARDWFAASGELLTEFARSHGPDHEGAPHSPVPVEAIARTARLFETLSAGLLDDAIRDAIGRKGTGGHPQMWPGQRRDIAVALRYIDAARAGAIADRAFIKTVTEAFQVDRTTVNKWLQRREIILDGHPEWPADQLLMMLRTAGARYHFNRKGERTEGVE